MTKFLLFFPLTYPSFINNIIKISHQYLVAFVRDKMTALLLTPFRVFHTSVSRWFFTGVYDNKYPQVSRTLLSILFDCYNAVVWLVSTRPLISKSSCPCTNTLETVPRALIIISITFMFPRVSNSLRRSRNLPFFFFPFNFTL